MTELNKYHFYASIVGGQAFVFKNLIDLLSTNIRSEGHLKLTKDGIYVCSNDNRKTILICADFPRSSFDVYKCDEERYIGANLSSLQNSMKTVKRKERLALYIEKSTDPKKLGIAISPLKNEPMEHQKILKFSIQFYNVTKTDYIVGCEYFNPIVIKTGDFQNTSKTLNNVGKVATITVQDSRWIKFFSDGDSLMDADLTFGDTEAEPESEDLKGLKPYKKDFESCRLNGIIKLTSMTNQIQIAAPRDDRFPLRFQIKAGLLGTISVYLKDKDCIQYETDLRLNNQTLPTGRGGSKK